MPNPISIVNTPILENNVRSAILTRTVLSIILCYLFFFSLSTPAYAGELSNQFTISVWVNPTSSIATKALVVKDTEVRVVTDSSGNPLCQIYASGVWQTAVTSSTALSLNTWSYVACSYDKANIRVFVNGVQTGTGAQTNALNDAATNLLVGQDDTAAYANFIGTTDNLLVYSYARTAGQITEDMNAGHPAPGSPVGSAVGYWKFDEGFGTTANNSGNQGSTLNGTLTSMASPATSTSGWTNSGKFGKALGFDGTNDYIQISDATALRPAILTLSAWVYTGSTTQLGIVTAKQISTSFRNSYILYANSGKMTISVSNTDGSSSVSSADPNDLPSNTWTHYAGTYDGTKTYLYKNGVLIDSDSGTVTIDYDTNPVLVGADDDDAVAGPDVGFWTGSIDEPKIYNYALTADQVKQDMNRSQAQVLGALSDNSSYQPQAANQEYCIPGDSTSCAAPVGEWKFEENQGTSANDTSGNANTGTWNGTLGSQWKPGKIGSAGNFNGSNNRVALSDSTSLSPSNITISAWVKRTSDSGSWESVVNNWKDDGVDQRSYIMIIDPSDKTSCDFSTTGLNSYGPSVLASTTSISIGSWYFITCTFDGTTGKVFVNGTQEDSATGVSGNLFNDSNSKNIGSSSDTTPNEFFPGLIDQVRLFNYVRSAAQVAWDYNRGAPVGHWKFDECQGAVANDSSGNGNTGTITVGASGTQTAVGTCTGSANTMWKDGATGKFNSSLDFDGTDDTVTGSISGTPVTSRMTISYWVKPAELNRQQNHIFLGTTGVARIVPYMNSANLARCFTSSGLDLSSGVTLSTGTWYHIVCTYDGTTLTAYVNGSSRASGTTSLTLTANNFTIGADNGSLWTNGQIDEPKIFNYALTATQVKTLMNDGAVRFGPVTGSP